MTDFLAVNRANWDDRVPVHVASRAYGVQRFVDEPSHLSDVVRFDMPRLGDVAGLRGVHLQCHIGTDTLSLARLGADMTGLDFSASAIAAATDLAAQAAAKGRTDFVQASVYDAVDVLGAANFDLVYSGIGALCWLPDIDRWAAVVSALLRPGGRLFIREGHPMLWSVDDVREDGQLVVAYPYFEMAQPLVFEDGLTYTDGGDAGLAHPRTYEWNHGLGEIVTAVLRHGMELTGLTEHRTVPWKALSQGMTLGEDGEWSLDEHPERLPLTYTLQAIRRS